MNNGPSESSHHEAGIVEPPPTRNGTLAKDGILELHRLLFGLRHDLETLRFPTSDAFREYDAAGVTPIRLDRDRHAHTRAVFQLARGLRDIARHAVLEADRARSTAPSQETHAQ